LIFATQCTTADAKTTDSQRPLDTQTRIRPIPRHSLDCYSVCALWAEGAAISTWTSSGSPRLERRLRSRLRETERSSIHQTTTIQSAVQAPAASRPGSCQHGGSRVQGRGSDESALRRRLGMVNDPSTRWHCKISTSQSPRPRAAARRRCHQQALARLGVGHECVALGIVPSRCRHSAIGCVSTLTLADQRAYSCQ